jgi:hypothetical protein
MSICEAMLKATGNRTLQASGGGRQQMSICEAMLKATGNRTLRASGGGRR